MSHDGKGDRGYEVGPATQASVCRVLVAKVCSQLTRDLNSCHFVRTSYRPPPNSHLDMEPNLGCLTSLFWKYL